MTAYDLDGQVFFVTGGGSGIGRASALLAARCGARVIVTDIDRTAADETASLAAEAAGAARAFALDVTDSTQVGQAVGFAIDTFGRIDSAFNSAGVTGPPFVRLLELDEAAWDRVIAVNLKGIWLCTKHLVGQMLKQGGGSIVNASSVAGLVGSQLNTAYGASKHGVVGLTKAIALEYGAQGIRTNCVCPGWTSTPMTEAIVQGRPEMRDLQSKRVPISRTAEAKEIAELVIWLCSPASSFVNGAAYAIDGGLTAQ